LQCLDEQSFNEVSDACKLNYPQSDWP